VVLLRQEIGDVLRDARREQGRTLREVSSIARVSLGYLSEVERGQKEASSELLAAICGALGRAIAGEVRGGFIVSMVLGFIGTLIGPWIAHQLKLPEPFLVNISGQSFPVLWSIIGAAVFVALIHLISRR